MNSQSLVKKIDDGHFSRTVEPDRHAADTGPAGGKAGHAADLPGTLVELLSLKLVADNRYALFDADLAAMGMPA